MKWRRRRSDLLTNYRTRTGQTYKPAAPQKTKSRHRPPSRTVWAPRVHCCGSVRHMRHCPDCGKELYPKWTARRKRRRHEAKLLAKALGGRMQEFYVGPADYAHAAGPNCQTILLPNGTRLGIHQARARGRQAKRVAKQLEPKTGRQARVDLIAKNGVSKHAT